MSGWIQGASAVGTMVFTALVVLVTDRLVRVTSQLATAAHNLIEFLSRNTRATEASAKLAADRRKPKVRISAYGYSHGRRSPETEEAIENYFG